METKQTIQVFFEDNFMVDFPPDFNDDDSFLENGIIDSTGVLELILFLEETFEIKVDDAEVTPENLDSFRAIHNFVAQKSNNKS
jgi:acyl carrier protein